MYIKDDKVIIFSDLHWGKAKDSNVMVNQQEKFIDWLIDKAHALGIKHLLFLGDWFENRSSISVKTYNHSYEAVRKISDAGLTLHMILGNHDIYYRDSNHVNSIKPLSQIDNVYIIDKPMIISLKKKKALLMPWDCFQPDVVQTDVMLGHFEFIGAIHNAVGSSQSKRGYNGNDITKVSPLVFSGHFHARKEYAFKHGKIVCVGCPLQLDWGDYGDQKGAYILDTNTLEYELLANTVNAEHIKVKWSDIKKKDHKCLKKVKDNYVKLIVDDDYKFENIVKVLNLINKLEPLKPCDTQYEYTKQFSFLGESKEVSLNSIQKSKLEHMTDYINQIDQTDIGELELSKLQEIAKGYFTKASEKLGNE